MGNNVLAFAKTLMKELLSQKDETGEGNRAPTAGTHGCFQARATRNFKESIKSILGRESR